MATPLVAPDVVGIAEVARLANVSKTTVSSWVSRGTTPPLPPSTRLAGGHVWRREHIVTWLANRAPVEDCSDCARLGVDPCNR